MGVHYHVRVRLDAVLAAGPRPDRVPAEYGTVDFVERGTLAAGCCGTLTPEVIVESVNAGFDQVPVYI